ncbi:MAG: hypothetical protein ACHQNV_04540 [Vicinamibacteria bacterium]
MNEGATNPRAREIWARTKVHVWPERYVLASLPLARLADASALVAMRAVGFAALIVERDEVSVTVVDEAWAASGLALDARVSGPFRAITLDTDVDLDVCGYLAPAATLLAEAGVALVPQCAFLKDHLLVHDEKLRIAVSILEEWIGACQRL